MVKRDYYEVLGVNKQATKQEIKKAYKQLAMKYHPDRTKGSDVLEEKFKEVQAAYEILSDADKRQEYDDFGHQGKDHFNRSQYQGFNQSPQGRYGNAGGGDFSDIFADMFRQQHQPRPEKGANVRYKINLTLREVIDGCQKDVKFPNNSEMLKIKIPKGIDDGQSVRLTGKGEEGSYGGSKGDLLVEIALLKDPVFKRDGADLHCQIAMSFPTAALGGALKVPTLDGHINLKIPKGTQTGRKFRIKGKGITTMKSTVNGDLIYELYIKTPESLTSEQEELINKLGETLE